MCNLKNIFFSLFLFTLFFSSCSSNSKQLSSAEKGVGVGAVLGAGVGALIGAGAGEPAAGAIMGTIAGATGGGLVGSSAGSDARDSRQNGKLAAGSPYKKGSRAALSNSLNSQKLKEERSFLGPLIWDRAPASANDAEDDVEQVYIDSNVPSGNKGLASKYSQIKLPSPKFREEPSKDSDLSGREIVVASSAKSRLSDDFVQKTTIEMRKPVEVGLPKAKVLAPTLNNEIPKANLSAAKVELPVSKKKIEPVELPKSKEVSLKKTVLEEKVEKIEKIEQKIDEPKLLDVKPEAKAEVKEEVAEKHAKLDNKPAVGSKCAKGDSEIKRAMNSGSDSDKVFYLRRAILVCPEESSLRVELGKVYGRLGLKEDARREFTSAIDSDPANETAQEELSIMMLDGAKK